MAITTKSQIGKYVCNVGYLDIRQRMVYKKPTEESMINIGSKVIIRRDLQDVDGMLYKGTSVRVRQQKDVHIEVSDGAGRLFWVKLSDISM